MESNEARDVLAGVDAVEARLAKRVGYFPPWRHALAGGLFALTIGPMSLGPMYGFVGALLTVAAARP